MKVKKIADCKIVPLSFFKGSNLSRCNRVDSFFIPKRQTIYQVSRNSFAGVLKSAHPSNAAWSEQCGSRDNNMADKSLPQPQLFLKTLFF